MCAAAEPHTPARRVPAHVRHKASPACYELYCDQLGRTYQHLCKVLLPEYVFSLIFSFFSNQLTHPLTCEHASAALTAGQVRRVWVTALSSEAVIAFMDLGNETAVDSGDIVLPDDPEQVS